MIVCSNLAKTAPFKCSKDRGKNNPLSARVWDYPNKRSWQQKLGRFHKWVLNCCACYKLNFKKGRIRKEGSTAKILCHLPTIEMFSYPAHPYGSPLFQRQMRILLLKRGFAKNWTLYWRKNEEVASHFLAFLSYHLRSGSLPGIVCYFLRFDVRLLASFP